MATEKRRFWGMPGPGGSIGKCAVCGDTFLADVLLGRPVTQFRAIGVDEILSCHEPKCRTALEAAQTADDWSLLPDGPLRRAYEKAKARQADP